MHCAARYREGHPKLRKELEQMFGGTLEESTGDIFWNLGWHAL